MLAKTTKIKLAAGASAAMLALAGCSGSESADQSFPSEGITFVIPYEPGGATDIIFRAALPFVEEELGQPVVPQNVPGASTTNGSRQVKDADNDGHTVLGIHEALLQTNIAGVSDYSFDAFEPVALLTETPVIAAVGADTGWESAEDFVEAVENDPGEISWGVTSGSTSHFFAQMMLDELGLPADSLNFVNYVGTNDALTAVQSGEIAGTYADVASAQGHFESGAFESIGVASAERLEELPEQETFEEQGYNFNYASARGIFAPAETPPEVVERLAEAFEAAVNDPEFQEQLEGFGTSVNYIPVEEYESYLEDQQSSYLELSEDMEF